MMGDYQVRFCERLRGETPLCLLGDLWASAAKDSSGDPVQAAEFEHLNTDKTNIAWGGWLRSTRPNKSKK